MNVNTFVLRFSDFFVGSYTNGETVFCLSMCVCVCVWGGGGACVCACMRGCVCVCVWVHVCVRACMPVATLTCPGLPYLAPRGPRPCQFKTSENAIHCCVYY